MPHSHIWCENRRVDLQKYRFHTLILYVNKHLKSCSLMPLHNISCGGYKTLFFIFISLQIRVIFEQHSIFGIWKAEDAANTTFTRSQDLCNSRHLFLIVVCMKVSRHHIVADLSPRYLRITLESQGKVCVFVCARVTRKLSHPHSLFLRCLVCNPP